MTEDHWVASAGVAACPGAVDTDLASEAVRTGVELAATAEDADRRASGVRSGLEMVVLVVPPREVVSRVLQLEVAAGRPEAARRLPGDRCAGRPEERYAAVAA